MHPCLVYYYSNSSSSVLIYLVPGPSPTRRLSPN